VVGGGAIRVSLTRVSFAGGIGVVAGGIVAGGGVGVGGDIVGSVAGSIRSWRSGHAVRATAIPATAPIDRSRLLVMALSLMRF
jgi:hypothetical protein